MSSAMSLKKKSKSKKWKNYIEFIKPLIQKSFPDVVKDVRYEMWRDPTGSKDVWVWFILKDSSGYNSIGNIRQLVWDSIKDEHVKINNIPHTAFATDAEALVYGMVS